MQGVYNMLLIIIEDWFGKFGLQTDAKVYNTFWKHVSAVNEDLRESTDMSEFRVTWGKLNGAQIARELQLHQYNRV